MANPVKGEVRLSAGDQDYVLVFGANAMAALEGRLDMSLNQIVSLFQTDVRITTLRAMLWAALLDRYDMTEMDAGRIMDAAGIETVGEKIGEAFTLALPKEEANGKARPQKAGGAGTGKKP